MSDNNFYTFFKWLFFTASFPYIQYAIPFVPDSFIGFHITGWGWIIMLLVALYYLFQTQSEQQFPVYFWIPWAVYIVLYILIDFSFSGIQLTLQYLNPLMVGIVASRFTYNKEKMHWLFKCIFSLSCFVMLLFAYGRLFRGGFTPYSAATPMMLSIMATLSIGIYFITKRIRFILLFSLLFLIPLIDVTRMGLIVFIFTLIFHFANKKIISKIIIGILGIVVAIMIFNSKSFQEKTFYDGRGKLSDISINYYNPGSNMNTNGRSGFLKYYETGLNKSPIWGNGPRADLYVLKDVWGGEGKSEAHNDYLSVRYNYGYFGLGLLLFSFIGPFIWLGINFIKEKNPYKILVLSSTMILFLTILLFMYSDNILKATVFYMDLLFALFGISCAKFEENKAT
jgi:hypothetical protein